MTELALNQDVAEYLRLAVETTLRDTFNFSVKFEQWSLDKRALALDASVACAVARTENNCDRGTLILALSRPAVMKILQTYCIKDTENAAIVNDKTIVFALVHSVSPGDGLHERMRLERFVEI